MKIPSIGNYLTEDKQAAIVEDISGDTCLGRIAHRHGPVVWDRVTGKAFLPDCTQAHLLSIVSPAPTPAASPWMDLEVGSPIFLDTLSPCIISKAEFEAGSTEKLGYYHAPSVSLDYLVAVVEPGVQPNWWSCHCQQIGKRPWMGLKAGDRLKLKDGNVAKVEWVHRFPAYATNIDHDVEVKFSIEDSSLSASYHYRADGSLRPDWWRDVAQVNPSQPASCSPSPGDRCYVDGSVWEVTECRPAEEQKGITYWLLLMKWVFGGGRRFGASLNHVPNAAWCQENLVPPSHWSRNLKVGDRLLEPGDGELAWTVEELEENDQYVLETTWGHPRTLCPIIDRNWFSKAKLLPRADPLPKTPAPVPWRERILQLIETARRDPAGGARLISSDVTFYMECSKVLVSRESPKNVRHAVHLTSPEIIGAFKTRMTQLATEAARAHDDSKAAAIEALLE